MLYVDWFTIYVFMYYCKDHKYWTDGNDDDDYYDYECDSQFLVIIMLLNYYNKLKFFNLIFPYILNNGPQ